ncbi:MAG: hypothetical protein HGB35_01015 [Geobacteraceae bacterium]|nr:hypothetical protein [Geobacteraceae bacterium]
MSTGLQQYIGYENRVTIYNIVATSEQVDYPATNLANDGTASKWKSNDASSVQYVTVTLGGSTVDYIGFAGHNFGSGACALVIQGQTAQGGMWTDLVASFSPANDKPILKTFTCVSYYAVRLKITPAGTKKPEAAVLYIGAVMLLPRNIYVGHTPIPYGRGIEAVNGLSESGAFLGRIIRGTTYGSTVSIKNMTPEWYRSTFERFIAVAKTSAWFYAWRLADYPEEIGYCWVKGGVAVPEKSGPKGFMSVSFDIQGIA